MKSLFEGVAFLFEEIAFIPYNFFRELELTHWGFANVFNWLFMLIGMVAFVYWMKQLKKYNVNNEEDTSVVSHSFLAEDK